MDASSRAELDHLRRRAYAPDADIDDDPVAAARLEVLEALVREEHLVAAGTIGAAEPEAWSDEDARGTRHPSATTPPTATLDDGEEMADASAPAESAARVARPRRRVVTATVVTALVVVVVGAIGIVRLLGSPSDPAVVQDPVQWREATSLTRDSDAFVLLRIPLRASFDDGVDIPSGPVPVFPTSGELEWAEPLGAFYGWNLWIAGARGAVQREHCLLAERGSISRARCVPATLRSQSSLAVALPYRYIPGGERPDELDPDERIGFWWNADGELTVLLADDPPR